MIKYKTFIFSFLILLFTQVNAQEVKTLNTHYSLSDTIQFDSEIRVYRTFNYNNKSCSSIFRIYKDENEKWHSSFYGCGRGKKFDKSNNELSFIFKKLLRNNILEIPSLSTIKWKLNDGGKIIETDEGYQLLYEKKEASWHGVNYHIKINHHHKKNNINYYCPEAYLSFYPEIDELIYINSFLDTIKNGFEIWE